MPVASVKLNMEMSVPENPAAATGNANQHDPKSGYGPTKNSSFPVYEPKESRRMLKNVIVISLSFTLLFSGYSTMSSLQSSINNDIPNQEGLGTYSQATVYAAMVVSSMFFAPSIIQLLGVKWAIALSMLGYGLYIGAQFYPTFYTMIPAGIAVGICAAPLWTAKSTYVTHLGAEYARHTKDVSDVIIVRFFGIFFFFLQSNGIWGNLLSSLVLKSSGANSTADDITTCGPNFCPYVIHKKSNDNKDAEEDPNRRNIYILAGVCLAFAAIVVVLFVDSMKRYGEDERKGTTGGKPSRKMATATLKQMLHPYQIFIIPITMWSGLEQGFIGSDITRAYITCSWGVDKIGWTFTCYGIVDAIGFLSLGPVVRRFGRVPVFVFGALVHVGLLIGLLFWRPSPDYPIVYFVITGLWGFSDSIWQTQINAVYGVLFPSKEEAAFSNYRLWESLGFIISFVNSNLLCIKPKICLLFGVLAMGMAGCLYVETKIKGPKASDAKKGQSY